MAAEIMAELLTFFFTIQKKIIEKKYRYTKMFQQFEESKTLVAGT